MNGFWDQPSLENTLAQSRLLHMHKGFLHGARGPDTNSPLPDSDSLH